MIHHDEVTWAYRMLLGREPESEVVLNHYATQLGSRQALRALFMQSAEFDEAVQQLPARSKPAALSGPAMAVQMDAAPDKLEALFDKISQQWHHLGDTEPHWSVLTSQSYLQNNIQDSARAFYASGVSELAVFDATLARVGLAGRATLRHLRGTGLWRGPGDGGAGAALRSGVGGGYFGQPPAVGGGPHERAGPGQRAPAPGDGGGRSGAGAVV